MNGLSKSAVAAGIVAGMVSGCSTTEVPKAEAQMTPGVLDTEVKTGQQLDFQLASGVYGCELGQKLEIQRTAKQIEVNWQGKSHTLLRYDSASGLPRYEDRQNGLLWIDLPWKGVLMDVRSGRPLANECTAQRS